MINSPARRSGRPRDPEIDAAVLSATLDLLSETGYLKLSIEAIARRAGTTKPALYRRWPTRQRLVLDALVYECKPAPVPDTGCTICDLVSAIERSLADLSSFPRGVLVALLADSADDSEMYQRVQEGLLEPSLRSVTGVLAAAGERGELRPGVAPGEAAGVFGALVMARALSLWPSAPADSGQMARLVLQGIAAICDKPASRHHEDLGSNHA